MTIIKYASAGCESRYLQPNLNFGAFLSKCVLINATALNNKRDSPLLSKINEMKKNGFIILVDSGGFQLATGACKDLNVGEIIEIQNLYGDIGMMLDVPPIKGELNWKYFSECLEETRINLHKAKNYKKNFKYYFVLQGETFETLDTWYNELNHIDTFDGVSLKGLTLEKMLLAAMYAIDKTDYKNFHFLGVSSTNRQILIDYLFKGMDDSYCVTYDSTTPVMLGKSKMMKFPFSDVTLSFSKVKNFDDFKDVLQVENDFNSIISLNVLNINLQQLFIKNMVHDRKLLEDAFSKYKLKPYFDIIDYFLANGRDMKKTIIKYSSYFEDKIPSGNTGVKQASLLGEF